MPGKQAVSPLMAKLGNKLKTAHEKHKNDEVVISAGGGLPAGIEQGIAQLAGIKFDTYKSGKNQGEYYFMAHGTVVSPKVFVDPVTKEQIPIEGERTQIGPEPLCNTPDSNGKKKTLEDHYEWMLNELRKLGMDTASVDSDELEAACAALVDEAPYFKFRTWKGQATEAFPNPGTNHDWRGVKADYVPDDSDTGVVDNTASDGAGDDGGDTTTSDAPWEEDDLSSLGVAADDGNEEAQALLTTKAAEIDFDTDSVKTWVLVAEAIAAAAGSGDEEDLNALAEAADGGDEEATARLYEVFAERGMDEDACNEYPTWVEALDQLPAEESDDAPTEEAVEPQVNEVWKYMPPKSRKLVDCNVMAVNTAKQTVKLKNLDDKKSIYSDVPFDKLVDATA